MNLIPEIEDLPLQTDEKVVGEWIADHKQGIAHFRGKVVLTNQRLAFQPTKMGIALDALAAVTGQTITGEPWSTPRSNIVKAADVGPWERAGEKGQTLRVELRAGEAQDLHFFGDGAAKAVGVVVTSALS